MEDYLKVRYFDELFDIFSSQKEGWYAFYADYTHDKVHWSQEMVDFLGLPARVMDNDAALSLYVSLIHPDDRKQFNREAERMLAGEIDELNVPYRIKNKNGIYTMVATFSKFKRDGEGKPVFYAGSVINYEKSYQVEPTTGLFTTQQMIELMDQYKEQDKSYFLMLFSVRDFSSVNNNYGYIEGNRVLRSLADIARLYRNGAEVFKLEGTKFAMLKAFDKGDESIHTFGVSEFDDIRRHLKKGIQVKDKKIFIDIYGGAVYTDDSEITPNTIYTSALFALAKAKENTSLDSLNVFNQSSILEDRKRLLMYNEIRESIRFDCKGFFLVYQPIIGKDSNRLVSMEALLRWYGDEFGEIFPGTFIEWLEKDTIFYDLGKWIIKTALEDAKDIIKIIPDFIVNINLAYPQLGRDEFEEELKQLVEESGVNPKNIRLELTERCKLLDKKLLRRRLEYIQNLGMQTSLDDFGTGYSAINLLFDVPTNQIKIDRSFIMNIQNEEPKRIMLKAIVDCARVLGAHVCVEGIETEELANYVKDNFNITSLQGFYYSRPIRLDEFKKNMHKWM